MIELVVYADERYPVFDHYKKDDRIVSRHDRIIILQESEYEDLLRVEREYEAWQDKLQQRIESL